MFSMEITAIQVHTHSITHTTRQLTAS